MYISHLNVSLFSRGRICWDFQDSAFVQTGLKMLILLYIFIPLWTARPFPGQFNGIANVSASAHVGAFSGKKKLQQTKEQESVFRSSKGKSSCSEEQ